MTGPAIPEILWREGMFLCPQHLQAFSRELRARIGVGETVGHPGRHGLLEIALDAEALERNVLRLERVSAVLRDGTHFSAPINARVDQREFDADWDGPHLDVYLGVPAAQENVPQVGEDKRRPFRYEVEVRNTYDENLRDAAREMEFKLLCGHVFFGDEDRSGYECIPIARLVRRGRPEPVPALSETFVPPILRLGASAPLVERLTNLAGRARSQAQDLAARLPDLQRLSNVEAVADLTGTIKLQAVNRCLALFDQLARVPDLHPYDVYSELVRAVGELSIFGASRVVPRLAAYSHDRLDECFEEVDRALREVLTAEVAVPYDALAFEADPSQEGIYYLAIPPEWLEGQPVFYLGVTVEQTQEQAADLISAGVKLLAPSDLENVLQGVLPGVALTPVRIPPLAFPKRPDLHFFRIDTEGASRELWLHVAAGRRAMLLSALGAVAEGVEFGLYVELRT